jgi:hypothetical protein
MQASGDSLKEVGEGVSERKRERETGGGKERERERERESEKKERRRREKRKRRRERERFSIIMNSHGTHQTASRCAKPDVDRVKDIFKPEHINRVSASSIEMGFCRDLHTSCTMTASSRKE